MPKGAFGLGLLGCIGALYVRDAVFIECLRLACVEKSCMCFMRASMVKSMRASN